MKAPSWPERPPLWISFDRRSIGLFRIGLGLLLIADLLRRVPGLSTWYTDEGLFPTDVAMAWSEWSVSLFFLAKTQGEAAMGFAACGLVYLGLLVGWKTRWFQILSFIAVVSLHGRVPLLQNGGDVVLRILAAWACFLPLGNRFSLDAWFAKRRGEEDEVARSSPFTSVAVLGLLIQFGAIYFYNTIQKNGDPWLDGTAVHYALHLEIYATDLARLVRDHLPLGLIKGLTWGTLVLEGTAPLLLLSPFAVPTMRRLAFLALPAMHLGFAIFLHVGLFSPTMMTFFLLLPTARDWEAAGRILSRVVPELRGAMGATPPFEPIEESVTRRAEPLPSLRRRRLAVVGLREAGALLLLAAIGTQLLRQNEGTPWWLYVEQPRLLQAIVRYPGLIQEWSMFGPSPKQVNEVLVVQARTASGAAIDPFNRVAAGWQGQPWETVPERLGRMQFWRRYEGIIATRTALNAPLARWISRHHERSGNTGERVVAFEAILLSRPIPPPGSNEVPEMQRRRIPIGKAGTSPAPVSSID